MMRITLVDQYPKGLGSRLTEVARAIQAQISEHFAPIWGADARLQVVRLPHGAKQGVAGSLPLSDGIVYLSPFRKTDKLPAPLAYHFQNHAGIPCGFVFPDIAEKKGSTPWSVALSHEILEMLVDPDLNLYVGGPHPTQARTNVLRAYEICDPVQASSYLIDDVLVANFVTPQYFTQKPRRPEGREPTHYLREPSLEPFGLLQGGYYSYYDLATSTWHDHWTKGDHHASNWAKARTDSSSAPRGLRRKYAVDHDWPKDDKGRPTPKDDKGRPTPKRESARSFRLSGVGGANGGQKVST